MATTATPPRPKPALFLPDSDDEDAPIHARPRRHAPPAPQPPLEEFDIDALFAGIPDDDFSAPVDDGNEPVSVDALDFGAMERAAEARARNRAPAPPPLTPHQVLPSSSPPRETGPDTAQGTVGADDDAPKKRKKRLRLDEHRMLGSDGFPSLIQMTKDFKIKGKGHEATDLDRLLRIYQYWTHKLHPPTQFRDTVERVEKLCHSKLMNSALSRWRDEAHGKTPAPDEDIIDISDDERGGDASAAPSSPLAGRDRPQGAGVTTAIPTGSSPPPTSPSEPASASAFDDDDFDIDAIIREEEERRARVRAQSQNNDTAKDTDTAMDVDGDSQAKGVPNDEDNLWADIMNGAFDENPTMPSAPLALPRDDGPSGNPTNGSSGSSTAPADNVEDDEDMWDVVREMEQDEARNQPPRTNDAVPSAASTSKASVSAAEEDWEDMYL
ncbi:hypothetical protein HGRIS_012789 [Hohenbuehelia grisea]|uniref:Chromosome segregation in meiosis protein n=1 Tax=Hohenbuehelia grisea TaxID=104357 RepID=A0ABR3ITK5_9AGAR